MILNSMFKNIFKTKTKVEGAALKGENMDKHVNAFGDILGELQQKMKDEFKSQNEQAKK